jgi:DNA-binding transcriptional LysR family regulator
MELQQLHHFVVVARAGSVARAAEELNLTQSGLSRSIKTLEESVGLALFSRQARGVALTAHGRALLGRATLIWNEHARAVAELRDMRSMRAGRVELGLHSVFNYAFGSDVLGAFAARHPLVTLSVWSGAASELAQRLLAGELEFAFTVQDAGSNDLELAFERLAELECSVFVRRDHALAGRAGLAFGDLVDAPWALCGVTAGLPGFEALFQSSGQAIPARLMETTSIALLVSAMLTRDLITILPSFLVKGDILKDRLVALDLTEKPPSVAAGLLYRPDMARTPATEALSEIFRSRASRLAGTMGV